LKKILVKTLLFFACLLLIPTLTVYAAEKESLEQFAGTDELWDQIPDGVDTNFLHSLLDEPDTGSFTKTLLEKILSLFSLGLRSGTNFFVKLCGLILFAALFRAVKDSFRFGSGECIFDFFFLLCLSFLSYSSLKDCLALSVTSLRSIHTFMTASLPVTTVLLTLAGSPTAAGTMAAGIHFALATVSTFVSSVLSPLVNTLFAFSMADGFLEGGLKGLINFIKKTVKVLCVLFFTLISATLALQNALATAADSAFMRSVRFAAGTFIPVVGSLLGESSKTLAASFSAVKAECGVLFILVLLYVLLRPILTVAIQKTFLGIASAFSEILGVKSVQGYLQSLSGILDLLMALLISEGCFLIFYVTLFITNRGGM